MAAYGNQNAKGKHRMSRIGRALDPGTAEKSIRKRVGRAIWKLDNGEAGQTAFARGLKTHHKTMEKSFNKQKKVIKSVGGALKRLFK